MWHIKLHLALLLSEWIHFATKWQTPLQGSHGQQGSSEAAVWQLWDEMVLVKCTVCSTHTQSSLWPGKQQQEGIPICDSVGLGTAFRLSSLGRHDMWPLQHLAICGCNNSAESAQEDLKVMSFCNNTDQRTKVSSLVQEGEGWTDRNKPTTDCAADTEAKRRHQRIAPSDMRSGCACHAARETGSSATGTGFQSQKCNEHAAMFRARNAIQQTKHIIQMFGSRKMKASDKAVGCGRLLKFPHGCLSSDATQVVVDSLRGFFSYR